MSLNLWEIRFKEIFFSKVDGRFLFSSVDVLKLSNCEFSIGYL